MLVLLARGEATVVAINGIGLCRPVGSCRARGGVISAAGVAVSYLMVSPVSLADCPEAAITMAKDADQSWTN